MTKYNISCNGATIYIVVDIEYTGNYIVQYFTCIKQNSATIPNEFIRTE